MRMLLAALICAWPAIAAPAVKAPVVPDKVADQFVPAQFGGQKIEGLLGERMRVNLEGRLLHVAEKMRTKDIHIRLYDAPGAATARGAQAFVITFGYSDRFKAQQVVREITGKFEEYNFSLQRNQANTTANFLTDELKKAKERVDAAQEQLGGFGAQHPGELPQDSAQNMSLVNSKEQEIHKIGSAPPRD